MMKNIVFAWSDRPVKMHGYSDGWVGACDDIEERGVAVRRPRRKMGKPSRCVGCIHAQQ